MYVHIIGVNVRYIYIYIFFFWNNFVEQKGDSVAATARRVCSNACRVTVIHRIMIYFHSPPTDKLKEKGVQCKRRQFSCMVKRNQAQG